MRARGSIGWQLCAPANLGLTLSSLSKLWGPLSVYWYSGLCVLRSPGVLVRSHSLSLSASICVVVWPCLLPHTSAHRVSSSFSCLCWHTSGPPRRAFFQPRELQTVDVQCQHAVSLLTLWPSSFTVVLYRSVCCLWLGFNCASVETVVKETMVRLRDHQPSYRNLRINT